MKAWLSQRGIPYTEKDVSRDQAAATEFIRAGYPGTPTVVIDGKAIIGFNRPQIEAALATPER